MAGSISKRGGEKKNFHLRHRSRVSVGQSLFEIETDEAVYEVESIDLGVISPTAVEGDSHPVGAVIGYIELSEEERIDTEYFVLKLTFEMREAIESVTHPQEDLP